MSLKEDRRKILGGGSAENLTPQSLGKFLDASQLIIQVFRELASSHLIDLRRKSVGQGRERLPPQAMRYNRMPAMRQGKDRNAVVLAALRIAVGLLFLIFGEYKVFGTQFTLGGGFQAWIHRFLANGAYPFMVPVLQNFVLAHGTAIAFLVAFGELAIGLGLVLGVLVRTASVCGLTYMLTLLFASNYPGAHAAFWQYFGAALDHLVFALCFAAFALGHADQVLSLRPKVPRDHS